MGREVGGRFRSQGRYIYLWLINAECMTETNTILQSNNPSIKKLNIYITEKKGKKTQYGSGPQSNSPCSYNFVCDQLGEPDTNRGDMGAMEIMTFTRDQGLGPLLAPGTK